MVSSRPTRFGLEMHLVSMNREIDAFQPSVVIVDPVTSLIAAGSDAANQLLVPGASLHDELSLLVAAGVTPLDAVAAATRRAAQLLRADSLGQLAPRKVADLVVLNRDPAADITATRDIAWVMIRGRIIHPDSLRRTWAH